ncbi:MAG: hypothetical protein V9G42_02120 [Bacteroidia bacterium]
MQLQEVVIKRKPVLYVTHDSIYTLTYNVDDFGNFKFNIGMVNIIDNNSEIFSSNKKNRGMHYVLKTIDIECTDTLITFNPLHSVNSTDVKTLVNNGVVNNYIEVIDDARFSYIYKKLRVEKIVEEQTPSLRILIPTNLKQSCLKNRTDIKPSITYELTCERIYFLYEIKFHEKSATFYKTIGLSNDGEGIKMIKKDSVILKDRDLNNLKKIITTSLTSDVDCRRPGEPSLLEYWDKSNYTQFIITDECLRTKKTYKKSTNAYFYVESLGIKYFR